jgi:hypothetical protein
MIRFFSYLLVHANQKNHTFLFMFYAYLYVIQPPEDMFRTVWRATAAAARGMCGDGIWQRVEN